MGSVAAWRSIGRVLEAHGEEIRKELLDTYVRSVRSSLVKDVTLDNDIYEIGITAELVNQQEIPLRGIPIDELAYRFPDCEVAY
jgi:hypothetical protein